VLDLFEQINYTAHCSEKTMKQFKVETLQRINDPKNDDMTSVMELEKQPAKYMMILGSESKEQIINRVDITVENMKLVFIIETAA
jgi:hypothetical protein